MSTALRTDKPYEVRARIHKPLNDRLTNASKLSGAPKSELVRRAVEKYLDHMEVP